MVGWLSQHYTGGLSTLIKNIVSLGENIDSIMQHLIINYVYTEIIEKFQ